MRIGNDFISAIKYKLFLQFIYITNLGHCTTTRDVLITHNLIESTYIISAFGNKLESGHIDMCYICRNFNNNIFFLYKSSIFSTTHHSCNY